MLPQPPDRSVLKKLRFQLNNNNSFHAEEKSMHRKPNEQQVKLLVDTFLEGAKENVDKEHKQTLYKIKGWFRTKFKVNLKTTLASGGTTAIKGAYKGGKQGVKLGLNLTLKNVPGVSFIVGTIQAIYDAVEYGTGALAGKLSDKIVKELAKKRIKEKNRGYFYKKAAHKYMANQGIDKIKNCIEKLKYASGLVNKPVINCNQFIERLHDLAWFEYRVKRLSEEIVFLKAYTLLLEEEADKFEAARKPFRKEILNVAKKLIDVDEDLHAQVCGELCLLNALHSRFPGLELKVPTKSVPVPPHGHGRPLPKRVPSKPVPIPHGRGRPLPKR